MWLHANGNVGIGTTNPGAELEIGSTVNPSLALNSITAGKQTQWMDYDNGTLVWLRGINYNNAGDGNFYINRSSGTGNILLAPSGSGNVGIGTTSPNAALEVSGSVRFSSANNALYFGANTGYTVIERGQVTTGTSADLYFGEPADTGNTY